MSDATSAMKTESVLLKEMSHRFSNMLQVLSSSLGQIVRDATCSQVVREDVAAFRERVAILADFHRSISLGPSPLVKLESHVRDLMVTLLRAFAREDLTPWVTMVDVGLPSDRQHMLTLLIVELVINALKHGKGLEGGVILVDLRWGRPQHLQLSVFNDHPASPNVVATPHVASDLARRLGGVLGVCGTDGYAAHLAFTPLAATPTLAA